MKLALSVVFAAALFATLASAQVGAPNPQASNLLAESWQKSPDGRSVLSNARMQITGTVEVRAEEITVSADGREMTLRGNVTMTLPVTPRPLK